LLQRTFKIDKELCHGRAFCYISAFRQLSAVRRAKQTTTRYACGQQEVMPMFLEQEKAKPSPEGEGGPRSGG